MDLREALQAIIDNKEAKALNWAVAYARVAQSMLENGYEGDTLRAQLLYLVGNISYWRGSVAQEVRRIIKLNIEVLK